MHGKSKSGDLTSGSINALGSQHKRITTADPNLLLMGIGSRGGGHMENSTLSKFLNQQDYNKTTFDAQSSVAGRPDQTSQEDDMQKFEKLLDKLMKEGKLDKLDLFRKLGLKSGGSDGVVASQLRANSVQSSHPKTTNILEERELSQSNDALLDE
jgi:hypothetical protein